MRRVRLGELWASPCCATFYKLEPINKEHQFWDAADPLRKPKKGTKKGQEALRRGRQDGEPDLTLHCGSVGHEGEAGEDWGDDSHGRGGVRPEGHGVVHGESSGHASDAGVHDRVRGVV